MKNPGCWVAAWAALLLTDVATGQAQRPVRQARSENGQFELRIEPGRPGRSGADCRATLFKHSGEDRRGRRVWAGALVNDAAPMVALVRNDGRFVVTLDEHRRGGGRHALVIYGAAGELLRHFLLSDLLTKDDWQHVKVGRRELNWLKDAQYGFADEVDQFVVALKWGRKIRIDLKTLQIVAEDGRLVGDGFTAIPADVLGQLLGHLEEDGERVIAQRLAELAELTPEEQAQTAMIAELLSPGATETDSSDIGEPAGEGLPEAVQAREAEPAEVVAEEEAPEDELAVAESVEEEPPRVAEAEELSEEEPSEAFEDDDAPGPLVDVWVPEPNPAEPTDYVAWLNDLGRIDGPDAAPLYDLAVAEHAAWEGDGDLLRAAVSGDPEALAAPETLAWLADNESALATFREASQYDSKGWEYSSPDGSLLAVELPLLSPLRGLARASVIDGRRLAAEGRPVEAADRYLDVLAAGGHTGNGMTLIENLVGHVMQSIAAEALLDLQDDPVAEQLDFVDLAEATEAAYRPNRPAAESLQGERAFFMDSVQRMWTVDPRSGEHVLNDETAREVLSMISADERDLEALWEAAGATSYEDTLAQAQVYFDGMTEAFSRPYQEGTGRMAEFESALQGDESANPFVRALLPSLSRYHFIRTRGAATRRGALLVTRLRAYRQEHGAYPTSLDVFGDSDIVLDPFGDGGLVYRRVGNDFMLYSVGGNGVDDGGVHDRKGDVADLRFWPRP